MQADLTVYLAGPAKNAEKEQNNKVLLGDLGALARAKDLKAYFSQSAQSTQRKNKIIRFLGVLSALERAKD